MRLPPEIELTDPNEGLTMHAPDGGGQPSPPPPAPPPPPPPPQPPEPIGP